jgi:putative acetyltransferase
LAVGALRMLDAGHAEVKSMHTAESARGQRIGRAMLQHLLDVARARGVRRVSLETGTTEVFAPARRLYRQMGFEPCAPFGSYGDSPFNICMTLWLPPHAS